MLVMRKKIYDKINVRFNGYYMMMNTLYYYLFLIILQVVIIYNQLLNVFKNGTIISLVRENLLPNWKKITR